MNTTQDILIGEVTKGQGEGALKLVSEFQAARPLLALPAPAAAPSPWSLVAVGFVLGLVLGLAL